MIKTYFKTAWRSIIKNKTYAVINISGLTIGIAATLLNYIAVTYELNYDTFQKNYDSIYRIVTNTDHADGNTEWESRYRSAGHKCHHC